MITAEAIRAAEAAWHKPAKQARSSACMKDPVWTANEFALEDFYFLFFMASSPRSRQGSDLERGIAGHAALVPAALVNDAAGADQVPVSHACLVQQD